MNQSDNERIDEMVNDINDQINRMRRRQANYMAGGHTDLQHHPRVKEALLRLKTAQEADAKLMAAHPDSERSVAGGQADDDEPAPGQDSGASWLTATRPDVLSSPYAGATPRYARQYQNVPGGEIRPDPIEEVAPPPPAEYMGAVSPEEADLMKDGDLQGMVRDVSGQRRAASNTRNTEADKREADRRAAAAQEKK